jgi:hypothetical protein
LIFSFYQDEKMNNEVFERLRNKCSEEQLAIQKEIAEFDKTISNPEKAIKKAIQLSSKLSTIWTSGKIELKEKLQKLVFPEGISFSRENEGFRTKRVNSIFELIALLSKSSETNKKGINLLLRIYPFQRRERDSNPRTCYSQRFSRPPH